MIQDEEVSPIITTHLSLAYFQLDHVPARVVEHFAEHVQVLDLSHNQLKNLEFLRHFQQLQTLILDRNSNLKCETLPKLLQLQVLWLNNCNIVNNHEWLSKLQVQCPNLRQLSMMCNPVGLTMMNGVTAAEEYEYRKQICRFFPHLTHLDGLAVDSGDTRNFHRRGNQKLYFLHTLRTLWNTTMSVDNFMQKALFTFTAKQVGNS